MSARQLVLRLVQPATELLQVAVVLVLLIAQPPQAPLLVHPVLLLHLQLLLLAAELLLGELQLASCSSPRSSSAASSRS